MAAPRRLTSKQAREIRDRCLAQEPYHLIGADYGISAPAVFYIFSGKNYKEPEAQPEYRRAKRAP